MCNNLIEEYKEPRKQKKKKQKTKNKRKGSSNLEVEHLPIEEQIVI